MTTHNRRIFPSADESRLIADLRVIHAEIRAIETDILEARDNGLRSVNVSNTGMTTSQAHFQAWKGTAPNEQLTDLQRQVIEYFEHLRYSIVRKQAATGLTFFWEIKY